MLEINEIEKHPNFSLICVLQPSDAFVLIRTIEQQFLLSLESWNIHSNLRLAVESFTFGTKTKSVIVMFKRCVRSGVEIEKFARNPGKSLEFQHLFKLTLNSRIQELHRSAKPPSMVRTRFQPDHECLRTIKWNTVAFTAFGRSSAKLNWSDRAAQVVSDGIVSGRSVAIGNGARCGTRDLKAEGLKVKIVRRNIVEVHKSCFDKRTDCKVAVMWNVGYERIRERSTRKKLETGEIDTRHSRDNLQISKLLKITLRFLAKRQIPDFLNFLQILLARSKSQTPKLPENFESLKTKINKQQKLPKDKKGGVDRSSTVIAKEPEVTEIHNCLKSDSGRCISEETAVEIVEMSATAGLPSSSKQPDNCGETRVGSCLTLLQLEDIAAAYFFEVLDCIELYYSLDRRSVQDESERNHAIELYQCFISHFVRRLANGSVLSTPDPGLVIDFVISRRIFGPISSTKGPASQGTPPNSPAAVSAFSRVVAASQTNKQAQNQVQGNALGLAAVLLQGAQAGSAGSGSSSGSSSNSQNSQTGASPSSPAAVYIGNNHAASPMVSSRRYDSSNNAKAFEEFVHLSEERFFLSHIPIFSPTLEIQKLEIRRVGGSGYMPLGQAECCDLEDGKKSTNAGKVAEKSKDKMDEDVCSKLSRPLVESIRDTTESYPQLCSQTFVKIMKHFTSAILRNGIDLESFLKSIEHEHRFMSINILDNE
ncbi:hypothetical protein WN51_06119 [Melipona quadrifasciata]|uniref:Uncharacterized protein n=1 Tax=Melipona quadrifasciata TaxID=166423 RepID=A0A0M8ZP44_9HYME|nr:hypothetical protein WN51_06119 [Melipona quadrifasciata]